MRRCLPSSGKEKESVWNQSICSSQRFIYLFIYLFLVPFSLLMELAPQRPYAAGILLLCLLESSITISLSVFGCKVICFVTEVSFHTWLDLVQICLAILWLPPYFSHWVFFCPTNEQMGNKYGEAFSSWACPETGEDSRTQRWNNDQYF